MTAARIPSIPTAFVAAVTATACATRDELRGGPFAMTYPLHVVQMPRVPGEAGWAETVIDQP